MRDPRADPRLPLLVIAPLALPQRQHIVWNHVEVRLLRIGVDADFVLAAISEAKLVISGLCELEGLRRGGLAQSERALAFGISNLDALRLFLGIAKIKISIHRMGPALAFAARKVARGLLDERNESGIQREIIGEVVEPRGEQHHATLADTLLKQKRRLVA